MKTNMNMFDEYCFRKIEKKRGKLIIRLTPNASIIFSVNELKELRKALKVKA